LLSIVELDVVDTGSIAKWSQQIASKHQQVDVRPSLPFTAPAVLTDCALRNAAFGRLQSVLTQSVEAFVMLRAGEHVMHCLWTCAQLECDAALSLSIRICAMSSGTMSA
jgi:hypothetical protein